MGNGTSGRGLARADGLQGILHTPERAAAAASPLTTDRDGGNEMAERHIDEATLATLSPDELAAYLKYSKHQAKGQAQDGDGQATHISFSPSTLAEWSRQSQLSPPHESASVASQPGAAAEEGGGGGGGASVEVEGAAGNPTPPPSTDPPTHPPASAAVEAEPGLDITSHHVPNTTTLPRASPPPTAGTVAGAPPDPTAKGEREHGSAGVSDDSTGIRPPFPSHPSTADTLPVEGGGAAGEPAASGQGVPTAAESPPDGRNLPLKAPTEFEEPPKLESASLPTTNAEPVRTSEGSAAADPVPPATPATDTPTEDPPSPEPSLFEGLRRRFSRTSIRRQLPRPPPIEPGNERPTITEGILRRLSRGASIRRPLPPTPTSPRSPSSSTAVSPAVSREASGRSEIDESGSDAAGGGSHASADAHAAGAEGANAATQEAATDAGQGGHGKVNAGSTANSVNADGKTRFDWNQLVPEGGVLDNVRRRLSRTGSTRQRPLPSIPTSPPPLKISSTESEAAAREAAAEENGADAAGTASTEAGSGVEGGDATQPTATPTATPPSATPTTAEAERVTPVSEHGGTSPDSVSASPPARRSVTVVPFGRMPSVKAKVGCLKRRSAAGDDRPTAIGFLATEAARQKRSSAPATLGGAHAGDGAAAAAAAAAGGGCSLKQGNVRDIVLSCLNGQVGLEFREAIATTASVPNPADSGDAWTHTQGQRVVVVSRVVPGGAADAQGHFAPGMQVLAVFGEPVRDLGPGLTVGWVVDSLARASVALISVDPAPVGLEPVPVDLFPETPIDSPDATTTNAPPLDLLTDVLSGVMWCALGDYTPRTRHELALKAGDSLAQLKTQGDWVYARRISAWPHAGPTYRARARERVPETAPELRKQSAYSRMGGGEGGGRGAAKGGAARGEQRRLPEDEGWVPTWVCVYPESLEAEPWFYGRMHRPAAEKTLRAAAAGVHSVEPFFLVRVSTNPFYLNDPTYVVSIFDRMRNHCVHYQMGTASRAEYSIDAKKYHTVRELVNAKMSFDEGSWTAQAAEGMALGRPCRKQAEYTRNELPLREPTLTTDDGVTPRVPATWGGWTRLRKLDLDRPLDLTASVGILADWHDEPIHACPAELFAPAKPSVDAPPIWGQDCNTFDHPTDCSALVQVFPTSEELFGIDRVGHHMRDPTDASPVTFCSANGRVTVRREGELWCLGTGRKVEYQIAVDPAEDPNVPPTGEWVVGPDNTHGLVVGVLPPQASRFRVILHPEFRTTLRDNQRWTLTTHRRLHPDARTFVATVFLCNARTRQTYARASDASAEAHRCVIPLPAEMWFCILEMLCLGHMLC